MAIDKSITNAAYAAGRVHGNNKGTATDWKGDVSSIQQASQLNLYKTDEVTRSTENLGFAQAVGMTHPVWDMLAGSDGFMTGSNLQDHAMPYINKFKVCELMMGSLGDMQAPMMAAESWGNWRSKSTNPAGIDVNPHIFLFPEEKNFSFGYTNEYGEGWDASDPGGMFAKVSQASELLRSGITVFGSNNDVPVAGKMMSRYKKSPTWKGTDPIKVNDLKFTFQFGQAGMFSGEQEVVRPILALASLWVPIETDNSHYYRGTLPTPPFIMMSVFKALANSGKGGDVASSGKSDGGGMLSKLTSLEESLIKVQEEGIVNAYNDSKTRALYIRMGRLVLGPFIVKDVNWDFDFSQVDEYGFPFKGTISFGGLESVVMPDPIQVHYGFTNEKDYWNSEELGKGGTGYKSTPYVDPPADSNANNSNNVRSASAGAAGAAREGAGGS
jgi:hypothetical protein